MHFQEQFNERYTRYHCEYRQRVVKDPNQNPFIVRTLLFAKRKPKKPCNDSLQGNDPKANDPDFVFREIYSHFGIVQSFDRDESHAMYRMTINIFVTLLK